MSQRDGLLSVIHERIATSHQEDEFDTIGKAFAAKLRKMEPGMALIAEKLIHDVLYEGMLGTLKPTTKLTSEQVVTIPNYKYQHVQTPLSIVHNQDINSGTPITISIPETSPLDNSQVLSPYIL